MLSGIGSTEAVSYGSDQFQFRFHNTGLKRKKEQENAFLGALNYQYFYIDWMLVTD
jgi:hypothetical protein